MINSEDKLKEAFQLLKDSKPNEKNIEKLYEIKSLLNIKDNDAIWIILLIFETYNQSFQNYPEQLKSVLSELLRESKIVLDKKAKLDIELAILELKKDVTKEISQKIIDNIEGNADLLLKNRFYFLISIYSFLFIIIGAVFIWFGYSMANHSIPNTLPRNLNELSNWILHLPAGLCVVIIIPLITILNYLITRKLTKWLFFNIFFSIIVCIFYIFYN